MGWLCRVDIFLFAKDWALGVLHAKIITAATLMGPQWRLKRVIEQVGNSALNFSLSASLLSYLALGLLCVLQKSCLLYSGNEAFRKTGQKFQLIFLKLAQIV